ncbi:MAG: ComEC/Rec2 family competence protein [Sphingobacteriaceae bacterium]
MNIFPNGEIPVFRLLMPLLAGIALGLSRSWLLQINLLYILLATALVLFLIFNIAYKKLKLYRKRWVVGLMASVQLLVAGIILAEAKKETNQSAHFSKYNADHLLVQINQEPKLTGETMRFTASVTNSFFRNTQKQTSGSLLIALKVNPHQVSHLNYGDLLLIKSRYSATDPPYNPAEFNYKKYLEHQNIYYQTFLNPNEFVRFASQAGNSVIAYALKIRKNMVGKFNRHMHNQDAISVASTLILGYRADLSKDVLQSYSKTGTMHVLSVSGMHVALLYLLIEFSLKFLNGVPKGRLLKAIISILLIWLYALLTGFSPAVCRAAVMITLVIMGKTYNRHISMLNILAISAFILLIYNPLFITDVGFQLSYIAVFGLIWLQPIIADWFQFTNIILHKIWSACAVSIAAQTITFPISIVYFHQFPIYFLFSNLFIVIPAMVIMYLGIGLLVFPEIVMISDGIGFCLEKTIILMNKTLNLVENLPFATWNKIWFTTIEYLLIYGMMLMLVKTISAPQRTFYLKLSLFTLLLLSISISWKSHRALRTENLTFMSLRKNSGIAFRKGNAVIMLTDVLREDKTFAFTIQPFLDSSKITELSVVDFQTDHRQLNFLKMENLIQFKDKTILIFDQKVSKKRFVPRLKINYLYVTGNPKTEIKKLISNYEFDLLIVDGRNSDFLIQKLASTAAAAGIKCKILKRNTALTLALN